MKAYSIKHDIIITLCSDNYVRVLKKHPENRFAIEPLYAISKTQSVVLLLFTKPNTIQNASNQVSELYNIDITSAKNVVSTIINRYSSLLKLQNIDERTFEFGVNFKEIKKILTSLVLSPNTLPAQFRRKEIPESVVVFISDTCMCDCIYCRVNAGINECSAEFMSLSMIDKIAKDCNKLGITDVELTGGDPLTHPNFIEILNIFKDNSVPVAFSTKCPIDKEKLIMIKDANVSVLQFSLDTIEANAFVKLTGTSIKYFMGLHKSILNAVDLGFKIKIKSVITRININSLTNMMESLYTNGVKNFVVQQLSCGDRIFYDNIMPTIDQYIKLDKDINQLIIKYSDIKIVKAYNVETIFASESQKKYFRQDCMAGISGIVIQVDGSYAYCGQSFNQELRFLNIKDFDILSAWNSIELKSLVYPNREKFLDTQCYSCSDFDRCSLKRCYIRTYRKFGEIYNIDPLCPHYTE